MNNPLEESILPYVLDELPPGKRQAFEKELECNSLLRVGVYETQEMLKKLRELPQDTVSRDLSAEILEAIKSEKKPGNPSWLSRVLKTAACLAVLAGAWLVIQSMTDGREDPAAAQGFKWIAAAQETSGAWDGARWGGSGKHTIELTSLALLTLASGKSAGMNSDYDEQIRRAAAYLAAHQDREGIIGEGGICSGYGHAIATCALLEVYRHNPSGGLKRVLDGAIRHLQTSHAASGGWAYQTSSGKSVHPTGSAWALLALKRAAAQGWPCSGPPARLPSQPASRIDLYPWYLLSTEFAGADRSNAVHMLELMKENPASDGCLSAGGQIYSTVLATLTLCAGNPQN